MTDTGERILREALALFAQNGYEAVSMRDIAGRLGLSQAALYRHFAGKRDIFESIVRRMAETDRLRAREWAVPEGAYADMAETYRDTPLSAVARFGLAQTRYWTEDAFARDFRRMLTLEQYRGTEMAALFQQYLGAGVVDYLSDLFKAAGIADARGLAVRFYAPLFLLMALSDAPGGCPDGMRLAAAHVERFLKETEGKP